MTINKHKGSTIESFLAEESILEHAEAIALKKIIAFKILQGMEKKALTKTQMASLMGTSRAALNRLLDPDNSSVTLITLTKAANVLGLKINISLI